MTNGAWVVVCSICVGLSGSARAEQAVSFADLQGSVIRTRVLFQQEGLSNGQPFQNQAEVVGTITINSADALTTTFVSTASTPRGARSSPPRSGSFTLGQPREVLSSGGGHVLWIFENSQLVQLRTFKAGAYKATISFSRGADGLRCTFHAAHAREVGIADLNWISPISGADIRMKSVKPISSDCQIAKR